MKHDALFRLPPRASLEHLKKQAKDLLDAHRRADPGALARIRDAAPSFAGMTDAALAATPFALHDAQSAIAREYGAKSWNELRDAVATQAAPADPSDPLLRALMPLPFPAEVGAAMREAGGRRAEVIAAGAALLPDALPLLAVRNALLVKRAIGPFQVARASSRAAVEAALARTPPTLAVLAQRAPEQEDVDAAGLHPVGCEAFVHARIPDGEGRAWIVLEGLRWVALTALDAGPGYLVARVAPVPLETGDDPEVTALAEKLRGQARDLANAYPDAPQLLARIDAAEPGALADLIVGNHPAPVEEKARYAAEPKLAERLRFASALAARRV
jgi:Lon protease-like protein